MTLSEHSDDDEEDKELRLIFLSIEKKNTFVQTN